MRKILLIPMLCAAMLIQGCTGLAGVALNGLVSAAMPAKAVGDKVVLEGTRGLILAHNAVQGALAIVTPLIRARVLSSDQVTMAETLVNQAERLFAGADATLTVAQRAASIMLIANQLTSIASAGQPHADAATVRQQVAGLQALDRSLTAEQALARLEAL